MPSLQPYGGKGWTLACLLPPSSISLYANILLKLESAQRGISRGTLNLSVNSQAHFSAATVFKMLLLDVGLYACLTWYFDQVWCRRLLGKKRAASQGQGVFVVRGAPKSAWENS